MKQQLEQQSRVSSKPSHACLHMDTRTYIPTFLTCKLGAVLVALFSFAESQYVVNVWLRLT